MGDSVESVSTIEDLAKVIVKGFTEIRAEMKDDVIKALDDPKVNDRFFTKIKAVGKTITELKVGLKPKMQCLESRVKVLE